jgi:hypothetical protein
MTFFTMKKRMGQKMVKIALDIQTSERESYVDMKKGKKRIGKTVLLFPCFITKQRAAFQLRTLLPTQCRSQVQHVHKLF